MLAPSVSSALLLFAAVVSGCIPRERREQEKDALGQADRSRPEDASAERGARNVPDAGVQLEPTDGDGDPPLAAVFADRFERTRLGDAWRPTADAWRIESGRLCVAGARNRPVWLKRRVPMNARVEFDALSLSADGDIKAELWGDGLSAAQGVTYDHATSYLVIFGGWKNRYHVLARLNEHANDRTEVVIDPEGQPFRTRPVVANRVYHFTVERLDGHTVRWLVNGQEVAVLDDQTPLAGARHDHIGFNDWETPVCFDNLSITPF